MYETRLIHNVKTLVSIIQQGKLQRFYIIFILHHLVVVNKHTNKTPPTTFLFKMTNDKFDDNILHNCAFCITDASMRRTASKCTVITCIQIKLLLSLKQV